MDVDDPVDSERVCAAWSGLEGCFKAWFSALDPQLQEFFAERASFESPCRMWIGEVSEEKR